MPDLPAQPTPPGKGLLGWLGRQVGHVLHAVKSEVGQTTIYRTEQVDEQPHPEDPNVTLRRTTIDEAVRVRPEPSKQG